VAPGGFSLLLPPGVVSTTERFQVRYTLIGVLVFICSIGFCISAESIGAATGVASEWYQPLRDLGVAGIFIAYLIYDRHEERKRKDVENKRWEKVDDRLLVTVENDAAAKMELAGALKELRTSNENMCNEIQRMVTIASTGNDHRRRASDKE
jgi:hypothetical protein